MCIKNKVIAAVLCAVIMAAGAFALGGTVQAQNAMNPTATTASASILEQLQQMVNSLMQQIQQLIKLIAQLKPLETCGNGICRFGETATSCPADCGAVISDNGKAKCSATGGAWTYSECASGCVFNTKAERLNGSGTTCATACVKDYICNCITGKYWASREEGCIAGLLCGNQICNASETAASCPEDCGGNDCVIGIESSSCCACPISIAQRQVGTDDWVIYEPGKDYSSFPKTENCQNIACSPCNIYPSATNCAQ